LDVFDENLQFMPELIEFFSVVADRISIGEGDEAVYTAFSPTLELLQDDFDNSNILTYKATRLSVLHIFASSVKLAQVSVILSVHGACLVNGIQLGRVLDNDFS
jgi:hypothetical protein